MSIHQFLAMVAVVLLLGVFSSKLSSRFNVPILLMFLAVGMLTGSDGLPVNGFYLSGDYVSPVLQA